MRACVVRDVDCAEFMAQMTPAIGLVNLIILSRGVAQRKEDVAEISRIEQCTVLAQVDRVENGNIIHSCLLADCGEMHGCLDASHALDGSGVGDRLRLLDVTAGRIGMLVGDDAMYPEVSRALRKAGAEFLVILGTRATLESVVLARAHAVANGIRIFCAYPQCGFIADFDGSAKTFDGRVVTVSCGKKQSNRLLLGLRPQLYDIYD